jgi:hypothetical protein
MVFQMALALLGSLFGRGGGRRERLQAEIQQIWSNRCVIDFNGTFIGVSLKTMAETIFLKKMRVSSSSSRGK